MENEINSKVLYVNPHYRKTRGSHQIVVSCGDCKSEIAFYQKVGPGRLLRMYLDRIEKSAVDLTAAPRALVCPKCKRQLGTMVALKRKKKVAYVMNRAVFNSSFIIK